MVAAEKKGIAARPSVRLGGTATFGRGASSRAAGPRRVLGGGRRVALIASRARSHSF